MLTSHALALVGGVVGTTGILAQAVSDPAGIGAYVGGGAGVVAVGALAEVTRRLLNGRLIPREIRESEQELAAYITAAGQREERAMRVAEDTANIAVKVAADVAAETRRVAAALAEDRERTNRDTSAQLQAVAALVEDLREDVRRLRRES